MHSIMLITSIKVFGRISERISPTAIQNRANPITRFIVMHPFLFCVFYARPACFMRHIPVFLHIRIQNIRHILLCKFIVPFCELVYHVRHHIKNLRNRILILNIHKLRLSILNH